MNLAQLYTVSRLTEDILLASFLAALWTESPYGHNRSSRLFKKGLESLLVALLSRCCRSQSECSSESNRRPCNVAIGCWHIPRASPPTAHRTSMACSHR